MQWASQGEVGRLSKCNQTPHSSRACRVSNLLSTFISILTAMRMLLQVSSATTLMAILCALPTEQPSSFYLSSLPDAVVFGNRNNSRAANARHEGRLQKLTLLIMLWPLGKCVASIGQPLQSAVHCCGRCKRWAKEQHNKIGQLNH